MAESKNCLVIHGCPGDEESLMDLSERTYTKHWIPWIRRELNARGIPTQGSTPSRTLGGKLIELSGRGHFTMGSMGTDAFPELLEEIVGCL